MKSSTKTGVLRIIVWSLNIVSIVWICRAVFSELGYPGSLRLIIPIMILGSTNLAAAMMVLFPNQKNNSDEEINEKS